MTLTSTNVLLMLLSGVGAGGLGAVLGIGGGIFIIPLLVLVFNVPTHQAVAASLVAVVATSTAAGSVYVGQGLTNMRLAMTLELATTLGAIAGGLSAALLPASALDIIFAVFTLITAGLMLRKQAEPKTSGPPKKGNESQLHGHELPGQLAGGFYDPAAGGFVEYKARRLPVGLAISFLAGNVSGLLGVGGGFLKVPAMSLGMGVPIKVAAATSNFMIGVTAAASFVIYYQRGFVQPLVATPVAVGVAVGALAGTTFSRKAKGAVLSRLLAVALVVAAVQMLLKGLSIHHGG